MNTLRRFQLQDKANVPAIKVLHMDFGIQEEKQQTQIVSSC